MRVGDCCFTGLTQLTNRLIRATPERVVSTDRNCTTAQRLDDGLRYSVIGLPYWGYGRLLISLMVITSPILRVTTSDPHYYQ